MKSWQCTGPKAHKTMRLENKKRWANLILTPLQQNISTPASLNINPADVVELWMKPKFHQRGKRAPHAMQVPRQIIHLRCMDLGLYGLI